MQVKYEKDELTLLQVRHNVTGEYMQEADLIASEPPFPIVQNVIDDFYESGLVSWEKLKQSAEATQGIEGWIIQLANGGMYKLKTTWYNNLHGAVTFTRWRDIAEAVIADKADDLKAAFALTGRDAKPIAKVQNDINLCITATKCVVLSVVNGAKSNGFTQKDTALTYKDHDLFGLIMAEFSGKTVDYMKWYAKTHLTDWSLEVVNCFEV